MSVYNPSKTVSDSNMECNGLNTVTISFDAAPGLCDDPADIVMIIDRSFSMNVNGMDSAKKAVKELISTVAKASGSTDGTAILGGSRMGIVSFAGTATIDRVLTTDVDFLNSAIDSLEAGGSTNHKAAFEEAFGMLQNASAGHRIMIMFTDGVKTEGGDPVPVVSQIKESGIEIYCIGLSTDSAPLNLWSSDPDSIYVAMADNRCQLDAAFSKIAAEVVEAGAHDMVIREVLNPDFKIVNVNIPTYGIVNMLDDRTLEWKADAVGTAGTERAILTFDIMHTGADGGVKSVNQSLSYSDRNGSVLEFHNPTVTVSCSNEIIVDKCPDPVQVQMDGCQDSAVVEAEDTYISGLGRVVQVDAVIKNVCPGKRVAAAVLLTEIDAEGTEYKRGLKTVLVPAQHGCGCRDIKLRCISFVVPEALDVCGNPMSICNPRRFEVRVFANYIDTDFMCCSDENTAE